MRIRIKSLPETAEVIRPLPESLIIAVRDQVDNKSIGKDFICLRCENMQQPKPTQIFEKDILQNETAGF
jgi:hypothetical protein